MKVVRYIAICCFGLAMCAARLGARTADPPWESECSDGTLIAFTDDGSVEWKDYSIPAMGSCDFNGVTDCDAFYAACDDFCENCATSSGANPPTTCDDVDTDYGDCECG